MNITFYKYKGKKEKIDKQLLNNSTSFALQLKEQSTLLDLTVVVTSSQYSLINANSYNYCYIDGFINRYYFIDNITFIGNDLLELSLHCDVLYTYRNYIKNITTLIERSQTGYDKYIDDPLLPISSKRELVIKKISPTGFPDTTHFYLVVNSGKADTTT